ncbi:MAG: GNAT family N-acetyltransferase [Sulfitobacter sp.]
MATDASVRTLGHADAANALVLYNELTVGPPADDAGVFASVINHPGTSVFGAFLDDKLVSMLTLHLLPNVLWQGRPYALIENVVTLRAFQKRGFGRTVMQTAIAAAWAADAYKIMLMTGQKRGAKGFYEAVGFSSEDKFAMVIRRS